MARAGRPLTLVVAYFDPYFSAHAHRLTQLREGSEGSIVVAVAEPEGALLSLRARAEMAAALGCVDFVVMTGHESLAADRVLDLREYDALLGTQVRRRVFVRSGKTAE